MPPAKRHQAPAAAAEHSSVASAAAAAPPAYAGGQGAVFESKDKAMDALHREHGSRGHTLRAPERGSSHPLVRGIKGGPRAKFALVCEKGCTGGAVVQVRGPGRAVVTLNEFESCTGEGQGTIPIRALIKEKRIFDAAKQKVEDPLKRAIEEGYGVTLSRSDLSRLRKQATVEIPVSVHGDESAEEYDDDDNPGVLRAGDQIMIVRLKTQSTQTTSVTGCVVSVRGTVELEGWGVLKEGHKVKHGNEEKFKPWEQFNLKQGKGPGRRGVQAPSRRTRPAPPGTCRS